MDEFLETNSRQTFITEFPSTISVPTKVFALIEISFLPWGRGEIEGPFSGFTSQDPKI